MYPLEADSLSFQPKTDFSASLSSFRTRQNEQALALIKKGIWLYFWLLIFEGALRKWIVPGLATPLLIVRDPIAIWLIGYGYMKGVFKGSFFVTAIFVLTTLSLLFTMLLGHGNLFVALYGARITLVHFPVIFLIGQVFTHKDVEQMGKAFLWTAIIQTLIVSLQFYSPQSAFINRSVGGQETIGFSGALGFFRPPGTFSFTNGLSIYYGLVAPFVFYFWLAGKKKVQKWLLIAATLALLIAVPLSISRTLFFEVLVTAAFTFGVASQKPKMIGPLIGATLGLLVLLALLSQLGFFNTGVAAFTDRFETASDFKESGVASSLADRFLGGMVSAISGSNAVPFWGFGLGMGTNAGAQLLTGQLGFLIAEGEWGRVVGEMGILLGLLFVIIRLYIAMSLLLKSFKVIRKDNYLPWLLVSSSFLIFLQGQWAQPTSLGFAVLATGLAIAAFNKQPTAQK